MHWGPESRASHAQVHAKLAGTVAPFTSGVGPNPQGVGVPEHRHFSSKASSEIREV